MHARARIRIFNAARQVYSFPFPSSSSFSSSYSMGPPSKLRIGYVPEHFSSPLTFAQQHYGLDADLIPFPTGTGALAGALKSDSAAEGSIDVAIGLTEGFVADLGKTRAAGQSNTYRLFGTYVRSPLRWAISTGTRRDDVTVDDLREKRVGVSRIGRCVDPLPA